MANSVQRRQQVRDSIRKQVDQYFTATLGRENDIVNIVNALVFKESSFNVNALGVQLNYSKGGAKDYYYSSAIQSKASTGSPTEVANLDKGLRAIGLMQVMGWNFIKGGSGSGLCELDRLRPDLSPDLVKLPGQDPTVHILGENNIDNAVRAGLIILEGKYKAVRQTPKGFVVGRDPNTRIFFSKISAAVACYLGRGLQDINGTTPGVYASEIVGGRAYQIANGKNTFQIADSDTRAQSSNGPPTNASALAQVGIVGC